MSHNLPSLPYSPSALEPHFDARTMEIHHGKHHQTYIDKLNAALEGSPDLASQEVNQLIANLSDLPASIQTAVRNNGGGHANHSFFWSSLSPDGGGSPSGDLADAISEAFGSFDEFKDLFFQAAISRFGSGWAWLVKKNDDSLAVCSTPQSRQPIDAWFC